jgi:hypothetical protein
MEERLIGLAREHDITAEMVIYIERQFGRSPRSTGAETQSSEGDQKVYSCAIM